MKVNHESYGLPVKTGRQKKDKIWLSSPHMGKSEIAFIKEAFDTNWVAPLGPNVNGFEEDLACYLNDDNHVAALNSGTAAIHPGLILLGVQAGDEVICQTMTFSASANPIIYLHAQPVFVDSEKETWNMSPVFLEMAIQNRLKHGKKPKAIIIVHLYGMPAKMDELLEISRKYEIPILEDAAEALGSSIRGKKCGTFGDVGILSFNGNKIITTSGGGALVSKNKEWVERTRYLATQARDVAPHYQHSQIGFNYRLSNICAGIGRGQMQVLEERVEQRRNDFKFYFEKLSAYKDFTFLEEPEGYFSNRWLTTILLDSTRKNKTSSMESIRMELENENIESRPLWKPMHLQPVFSGTMYFGDHYSESLFACGLCLPSGSNLSKNDLQAVVDCISELHKSQELALGIIT